MVIHFSISQNYKKLICDENFLQKSRAHFLFCPVKKIMYLASQTQKAQIHPLFFRSVSNSTSRCSSHHFASVSLSNWKIWTPLQTTGQRQRRQSCGRQYLFCILNWHSPAQPRKILDLLNYHTVVHLAEDLDQQDIVLITNTNYHVGKQCMCTLQ
jgi:hypothetical protein